jgi:outer membrane protein
MFKFQSPFRVANPTYHSGQVRSATERIHLWISAVLLLVGGLLLLPNLASAQSAPAPAQLERYIDVALGHNPDMQAARSRWKQSDARVDQANSNLWPKIDVTSTYTNFTGGRVITLPSLGSFSTAKIGVVPWDNSIGATWNIFNYAVWEGTKATKAYLAAATSELSSRELGVAYQVSDAYYSYAKATELVAVRENAVQLARQSLSTAQSLFKVDKAPKNDVLRAEVAVASSRGDLLSAKNMQNLARTNFNNLLKRNAGEEIELPSQEAMLETSRSNRDLAMNDDTTQSIESTTYEQDLEQAYHNRPDLAQLSQAQEAVNGLRAVSFADNIPNLALFARYGWQEDQLKFSSDADYLAAGVTLRWNLFTGGNTRAKVAENDAQMEEIEFQKESAMSGIRLELQNARLERQNARERHSIAIIQLQSAEENQRITKAQYDAGMAPLITMIDAQTTLANAKANLTVTTFDVLLAEAKYRKALGLR